MTRSALAIYIGLMVLCTPAFAIIYVPGDSPTIDGAISMASPGDTIIVLAGTYKGEAMNITFNLVLIAQGGAIIDADSSSRAVSFQGCDETTEFIGFTVQNGVFETGGGIVCSNASPRIHDCIIRDNTATIRGGGIYVLSGSPDLFNNTIMDNSAPSGAGIYIEGGGPERTVIRNCVITGNTATDDGGGIYIGGADVAVSGSNIGGNQARRGGGLMISNGGGEAVALTFNSILNNIAYEGGGVFATGGSDTLRNNSVLSNQAIATLDWGDGARGGGLFISDYLTSAVLDHNIWYSNSSDSIGGGIAGYVGPEVTLLNEVIADNSANIQGGGIHAYFTEMRVLNSSITGNTAPADPQIYSFGNPVASGASVAVQYSNVEGGWAGLGVVDVDPRFRDPLGGDFRLMSTACGDPFDSPLIDAGDPGRFDALLDCDHGLGTNRSDIGAYGGSNTDIPTGLRDDPGSRGVRPEPAWLGQNYPNPFNPSTRIDFAVAVADRVRIEVFDLLGRHVTDLADGVFPAGEHTIMWHGRLSDGRPAPSGIYFYRITTEARTETRSMLLLK